MTARAGTGPLAVASSPGGTFFKPGQAVRALPGPTESPHRTQSSGARGAVSVMIGYLPGLVFKIHGHARPTGISNLSISRYDIVL